MRTLSGTAQAVPEFWEAVLERLHIYNAKARLRQILVERLRKLKKRLEIVDGFEKWPLSDCDVDQQEEKPTSNQETQTEDEDDIRGNYSPEPEQAVDDSVGLDPDEDEADLERTRTGVLEY